MKKISLLLSLTLLALLSVAQTTPVSLVKKANHFLYMTKSYGQQVDTAFTHIFLEGKCYYIAPDGFASVSEPVSTIPGHTVESTFVDLASDSVHYHYHFDNEGETFSVSAPFSRPDIKWDTTLEPNGILHYVTSINSNRLEVYVQPSPLHINPIPYYGHFPGIVLSFWRNGQMQLQFFRSLADRKIPQVAAQMKSPSVIPSTTREISALKKQRMIISHRIFDDVQLCWGKTNAHISGDYRDNMPFDTVLHFAGGTLALKRVNLPTLPSHYQTFVEIHQRSNGDAYDRTGSLFVIPNASQKNIASFFDGINNHPDSLPIFLDRKGQRYQGIRHTDDYYPPIELVRFFTSFGVGHFNDRMKGYDGIEWGDENYFKQEVSDLSAALQGDCWIGIWIGNYDGGGHKVTVDFKSYPNDESMAIEPDHTNVIPLFNTTNVLEMAGQNYGQLFDTDSLSITIEVPEHPNKLTLRLISTGHGGWDGGDEFNPKTNHILIDGQPVFAHTPWRCDCARYREWNPVSGNFWNGISSSDLSRSGWCPGTATQPVYFNLSHLAPGKHTFTLAIPQGAPQEGSISHWCVSAALLVQ